MLPGMAPFPVRRTVRRPVLGRIMFVTACQGNRTHMGLPPQMASVLRSLQRRAVNPVVRFAWDLRLPIPGDALLETTGRRTKRRRQTPVCDGLDGDTFWLVSQRGHDADWVANIAVDPRVRIKVGGGPHAKWRTGTAHILDDDDPHKRQQILAEGNLARRFCLYTSAAVQTDPLTVRI